jgi:hypothetical protein
VRRPQENQLIWSSAVHEAVALLQARVEGLTGADADRLAAELGDLPLAIAQAAGFMAETGMTAAEYLRLLRTRAGQLLAQGAPGSYSRSLAAATQLTADRLASEDPAATGSATIASCTGDHALSRLGAPGRRTRFRRPGDVT